ncbi:MAG TPA: TrmH family RNA methyltransferase [Nevskiaceae bacterium]|nr:TrmH family RNA methyltransferase [Nevskiaceae bacterium]
MRDIILIAHNLRSCHNVGSLLRTAEGLGVTKVYLTGYTPYPLKPDDTRLPHLSAKIARQINKTALGAESTIVWEQQADVIELLDRLKKQEYTVAAIEQAPRAIPLPTYRPPQKIALIVGREVEGIEPEVLAACGTALEIPMFGHKESFNVAVAAAMAMYHCRFTDK